MYCCAEDADEREVRGGRASWRQARGQAGDLPGRASREKILTAARRVFEGKGYAETRIADIVAQASVATGSFYVYFADKSPSFVRSRLPWSRRCRTPSGFPGTLGTGCTG
ncbi:helix-turn-helix domain-containing protein [Streptomyces sp. NPDC093085]|uniref:TetR/AcrR family transcriptional regulator n=1 Tax=Streptomyces sp. NPDC093085 TaxID=3155068 RepID=UPI0034170785